MIPWPGPTREVVRQPTREVVRGHHCPPQPRLPRGAQVAARALEHLDAVLGNRAQQRIVLAVAEALDGLGIRRVVRVALGQHDASAGEEITDAVRSRLAVDARRVVRPWIERDEPLACPRRPFAQVRVEHLGPSLVVHRRRVRQHPVEIEEARGHAVRQSQHLITTS